MTFYFSFRVRDPKRLVSQIKFAYFFLSFKYNALKVNEYRKTWFSKKRIWKLFYVVTLSDLYLWIAK